jgi:myo-inositol 2-dehydrogenase/D-chiro-inositol 1-dehydrogenase
MLERRYSEPARPNRRDFLKYGAAAAAAVAAIPRLIPATFARAEDASGEKPTIALIGAGGRGYWIGQDAAKLGRMIACADVHRGHAEKFAARIGDSCRVYQDYRRVLDRGDIETVVIATPDHWHAKIAIEAMQAGKDVYCEKPLTLTIDEGKKIRKAVRETDKVFQVGTHQRSEYNNAFLEAVAIARGGKLGEKLSAEVCIGTPPHEGPFSAAEPPKELDWDFWLGQTPKVPYCEKRFAGTFRWFLEYAGGLVTDWGAHHVDIALWALGGEETGIADISGRGEFPLKREETLAFLLGEKPDGLPNCYNVPTAFDCAMTLPNGNTIRLHNTDKEDILIVGEKGRIAVNRGGLRGRFAEALKSDPAGADWLAAETAKLYRNMPMQGHMANFFHCVKTRALPISDVFTHCNSLNACHAANIAMLVGRKLRWDKEKEEFAGDDEANRLIRRAQRPPYVLPA